MSRVNIPELDKLLNHPFKVLDKGEIRIIEYMGTDSTIVNAARVSYGEGTKTVRDDQTLINYLLRNKHTSPFEMCEIVLYIKLPIFVAAQWIRHRTANINSYSARYSILKDEFYVPEPSSLKYQDANNKQASGNEALPLDVAMKVCDEIAEHSAQTYALYESMMERGVSREYARMILPQNIYTYWYWKIDLHNLMHFLTLRLSDHAQYEIQEYAKVIFQQILPLWVPYTHQAYCDHRLNAMQLSQAAKKVVLDHVQGTLKSREEYTHSGSKTPIGKGEWNELMNFLRVY